MSKARIENLGDTALLLRLGDRPDPALDRRIHALAARLAAERPPWLRDLVPAYASLALHLDTDSGPPPLAEARVWLERLLAAADAAPASTPGRRIEIPVHYGGAAGPDLAEVAAAAGLSVEDAVACHANAEYTVAMLGFSPGFPYLTGLPPSLAIPRLANPRPRVPAGSVAIGGAQAGIYPTDSPGGWRVIGRTPEVLFDPRRDPPALLAPGDRVRFVPVARP